MNKNVWNKCKPLRSSVHVRQNQGVFKDLLLTLAAALWTGLASSFLFVLLVFVTSEDVQAAEDGPGRGTLALFALDGRRVDDAPLQSTDIQIEINGMLARVRVGQHFTNPGRDWLEGVYQFPLPDNSAVEQLRMKIGERLLEGEIQEREKAKALYQKTRAKGHRATLVSQQRPNIFTTSVANIGTGETIQIEIEYQQTLRYDQGRFHLRLPLVIGPRYIPGKALTGMESIQLSGNGWALDTDQVPDASHITPPVAEPRDGPVNPVSLTIRLNPGMELDEIRSPYHELVHQLDDQGVYLLSLKSQMVPADRDFELQWKPKTSQSPKAAVFSEEWDGQKYALLMLVPPELETSRGGLSREVVFVVDTSGSMHGASIRQARAALQLALSRLDPQDRFNVIQFNDRVRSLFNGTVPANRRNLDQALEYVGRLQAEGGTEMLPAMQMALQSGTESNSLRQLVFLTDGSVGNEQALFTLIKQNLGDSRLFTIGIGSAPNSYFMQRAADFGRGSFTYIGDLSEVESRMLKLFEKLEHPALVDVQLIWDDGRLVDSFPAKVPDLYRGEPLLVALKADELSGHLSLVGQMDGSPWQQELVFQSLGDRPEIHTLWARAKIKDLMAELSQGVEEHKIRSEVLGLALKHKLVSRYTSLVVVDQAEARDLDKPLKQGSVPTNLPHGWTASRVFGHLPQTATASRLHLLIGMTLLLVALFVGLRFRVLVR